MIAAIEVHQRTSCVSCCHGAEQQRAPTTRPAARPLRERRLRSDTIAEGRVPRPAMPRGGCSGGGVRRPGAVQRRALRGWLDGARLGSILLEREMRARAVVVADVAVQTATEVSLIQDDHMVEELAADGADHAFDQGILPWRTGRRENLGDAHAVHPSPKLAAVDAVAIAEEIARRRVIGERLDELLRGPGGGRGIGQDSMKWLAPSPTS